MDTYWLARFGSSFVLPLAEAIEDSDLEKALVSELGFALPSGVTLLGGLRPMLESVSGLVIEMEDYDPERSVNLDLLTRAAAAFRAAFSTVQNLGTTLNAAAMGSALVRDTDALEVLPRRLLDYLTVTFLEENLPVGAQLLRTFGMIEEREMFYEGDLHRVTFVERAVHWDRLSDLISDPISQLKRQYGFETAAGVETPTLFERLRELATSLGLHSDLRPIDERARLAFDAALAGAGSVPTAEETIVLRIPFLPTFEVGFGVELYPIANSAGIIDGFGIGIYADSDFANSIALSDWLTAQVSMGAFANGFGALLRSGQEARLVSAIYGADPAHVLDDVAVNVSASLLYQPPEAVLLLGGEDATRWEAGAITVKTGFRKSPGAALDFTVEISLANSVLIVQTDECDGFLEQVLGRGLKITFDLVPALSLRKGFYFGATGALDYSIPVALKAGSVSLQYLTVSLGTKPRGPEFLIGVTGALSLGPVSLLIKNFGLVARVDSANPGIFGNADLQLGFKPPSGLGLAIEAPAIIGGGFLHFDPQNEEYSGTLDLQIEETIAVKATGLLITRLPDGAEGYSLLIIIMAEDFEPIPLGWGFNLAGIGGLLAINRTFDEAALRTGLRNHMLDAVLFPNDPIRNAPQILSNLNRVFPPVSGHHLFGPMAQIAWGTPTLITADLAVVLELGLRLRLLVLAQVSAILPKPDEDLIRLQMDAVGVIDFDQGTAALDATLHDSRLLRKFPLTGDMAMRLTWENSPTFALAVGGLHPAFHPPPNFPTLERITINLAAGNNPRLRCEAYIALTANTVQFGARAELYAAASGVSLEGETGFDVLIQPSPFSFLADFYAQLQLKRNSTNLFKVRVDGALAGPRPLHLKAKATFEILWWDVTIRVDTTLVEGEKPPLPTPVDVFPLLRNALASPGNWVSQLPPRQRQMVTLRRNGQPTVSAPVQTLLHPLGTLAIKQNVVPLDLDISRFGSAAPAGARRFSITSVSLGDDNQEPQPLRDFFAPAQFIDMSDHEKLSRPSFESMTAGVVIGSDEFAISANAADWLEMPAIEFETLIVDKRTGETRSSQPAGQQGCYRLTPEFLGKQARFGAAGNSELRRAGKARYRSTTDKYQVAREGWTVVTTDDLVVRAASVSYSEAVQAMTKMKRQQPTKSGVMKIVRTSELSVA